MSGYFGTAQQQTLQQRTQLMGDWVAGKPGIYNAGRFMGIDRPDCFDPKDWESMLARDGLLGFRMISEFEASTIFPMLEASGLRVDRWDIFVGTREDAGLRATTLAAGSPQNGVSLQPELRDPQGKDTIRMQEFLAESGLAPFPGEMLVATPPLSRTIVLAAADRVIATGHTYFPHNIHSPFHRYAWIGLIAVDHAWRGKGLGRLVNALTIRAAFDELGASHVYEMVAPANTPSRRMIEDCGLQLDRSLNCGVAVRADSARFTR